MLFIFFYSVLLLSSFVPNFTVAFLVPPLEVITEKWAVKGGGLVGWLVPRRPDPRSTMMEDDYPDKTIERPADRNSDINADNDAAKSGDAAKLIEKRVRPPMDMTMSNQL